MKKESLQKTIVVFSSTLGICAVSFFLAAPETSAQTVNLSNPLGDDITPQTLIGAIVKAIIGFTGTATLLMLVWGGFLWLTAAGDPKRIKTGTDTMMWAVIGLAVIFGAYVILDFIIKSALGVV